MTDALVEWLGIYAGMLAIGVVSGLVPFLPVEVALAAVVAVAGNVPLAIALGLLAAVGQMIAKAILFQGAQRATRNARDDSKLARARDRIARWRDKPMLLTFVAASVGIPPMYVVSLFAGALGIGFRPFLVIGLVGRSLRFVTVALIALYCLRYG